MTHEPASPVPATQGVTLLPRHWAWLATQPHSPSATLRRLVDAARRDPDGRLRRRDAQAACYRFLRDVAGDRAGFEDAVRALFAGDAAQFDARLAPWPDDIQAAARQLAAPVWSQEVAR